MIKEALEFTFAIKETQIDESQHSVLAGIIEGDSLSANNRFYPLSVVEKAIPLVKGRKSLIGHETDSVEDVVAVIEDAHMSGKLGIGKFRFGHDEKSNMIFQKIKEGLIDSVSIRAHGDTRTAILDNQEVEVVDSLSIYSVDWVLEGGVKSAKVLRVFEQSPDIKFTKTKEEKMEIEELKTKLAESEAKVTELTNKNAELTAKIESAEKEKEKARIKVYKESKLATIKDEEVRSAVAETLTAETDAEIDKQFESGKKLIQSIAKKNKVKEEELIIDPADKKEEFKPKSVGEALKSDKVSKEIKKSLITSLLGVKK